MTERINRPHPIQPPVVDHDNVLRFKENRVVSMFYEKAREHGFGLDQIAQMVERGKIPIEDLVQFHQLRGYTVDGASDITYFPRDIISTVELMHETGLTEKEARLKRTEEAYARLQQAGIVAMKELYDGIAGPGGDSSELDDMLAGR